MKQVTMKVHVVLSFAQRQRRSAARLDLDRRFRAQALELNNRRAFCAMTLVFALSRLLFSWTEAYVLKEAYTWIWLSHLN